MTNGEKRKEEGGRKERIETLKSSAFDAVLYIFHEECVAVINMEHMLDYIEAKAFYRAKIYDYGNVDDTYQICIRCQFLVDRVFRNCWGP